MRQDPAKICRCMLKASAEMTTAEMMTAKMTIKRPPFPLYDNKNGLSDSNNSVAQRPKSHDAMRAQMVCSTSELRQRQHHREDPWELSRGAVVREPTSPKRN